MSIKIKNMKDSGSIKKRGIVELKHILGQSSKNQSGKYNYSLGLQQTSSSNSKMSISFNKYWMKKVKSKGKFPP